MFFFKQKTAYEMRISDWSSDVCSSDLTRSIMSRRLSQQPDRRKERGGERPELLAQLLPDTAGGKYSGVADEEVALDEKQIGRASCRERVCQYVSFSVVAVSLKKKIN